MDKIKILKVEPGKPPCVKEIANDFKASQAEVEDVYKRQPCLEYPMPIT